MNQRVTLTRQALKTPRAAARPTPAAAYSTILTRQRGLHHVYVDAFAGAGVVSVERCD